MPAILRIMLEKCCEVQADVIHRQAVKSLCILLRNPKVANSAVLKQVVLEFVERKVTATMQAP